MLEAGLKQTTHPHSPLKGTVFFKQEHLNSLRRVRYENVTCLCTIQMTSWWKLRGIHCPPLSNYVRDEDKKHSWAVLLAASGTIICTTNYSRDFWHLRNRSTITSRPCTWKQGKHKSYSRRKAGHYGTALCSMHCKLLAFAFLAELRATC